MAYTSIPKDLSYVKNKFIGNFTKRQIICLGIAGVVSIPVYLIAKNFLSNEIAMFLLLMTGFPIVSFAIIKKNDLPLEKYLKYLIETEIIRPKIRTYKTKNFYAILSKEEIEKSSQGVDHSVYHKQKFAKNEKTKRTRKQIRKK